MNKLKLTKSEYDHVLTSVKECIDKKNIRPALKYINIKVEKNLLTAVALDGYTLSKVEFKLEFDNPDCQFLSEPIKIDKKTSIVEIHITDEYIKLIEDELRETTILKPEGEYPDYERVLKAQEQDLKEVISTTVDAQLLLKLLKGLKNKDNNRIELNISLQNKMAPLLLKSFNHEIDSEITKILLPLRVQ